MMCTHLLLQPLFGKSAFVIFFLEYKFSFQVVDCRLYGFDVTLQLAEGVDAQLSETSVQLGAS